MSPIRLNQKSIFKLLILLVFCLILKFIAEYLYQKNQPSLDYDYSKREFILNLPKGYFEILPQSRHFSNDFYVVDTEPINLKYWTKFQIKSVKFKYSKIFLQDWVPFLQEAINLGINTIEIEIVWNVHEKINGSLDFKSYNLELEELVKLIKAYRLFLIVRIDPFLPCSDYDMGGLPNWLLADSLSEKDASFLSLQNEKFIQTYQRFLDTVLNILAKYQFTNKGPILGFLIQFYEKTEPNSYKQFYDGNYKKFIIDRFQAHGIVEIILKSVSLCDYNRLSDKNFKKFCDPNLFLYFPLDYKLKMKNDSYHDCTNLNSQLKDLDYFVTNEKIKFRSNLNELLITKKSFGIKKFFCYPNFGFEADSTDQYLLESQNCLLDKTGARTEKFDVAFQILNNKQELPARRNYSNFVNLRNYKFLSDNSKIYNISISHVLPFRNFVDKLPAPTDIVSKKEELFIEYLGITYNLRSTGYGYMFYRLKANLKSGSKIIVKPNLIKDYTTIKCDYENNIITLEPEKFNQTLSFKLTRECKEIQILVEIFKRSSTVNTKWSEYRNNRKGLLAKDAILLKRSDKNVYEMGKTQWKINLLDFLPKFFNRIAFGSNYLTYDQFSKSKLKQLDNPIVLYAKLYIQKSLKNEFVYLIVKNLNKGVVFFNGFNLARYSDKNKVNALFVPKKLLNNGSNEILIFDLHGIKIDHNPEIFITKELVFI